MSFELRTYTSIPGRLDDVVARFRDHTVGILATHNMESLGYWTSDSRPDTLVYLLRHVGDPAANWAAFQRDPVWIEAKTQSVTNGEIVARIESEFLSATDFSAIA